MRKGICLVFAAVLLVCAALPVMASEDSTPGGQTEEHTEQPAPCQHSWGEGTVTAAPSCTAEGGKRYTCGLCGAEKVESLPAAGHSFGAWQKVDEASHKRACSACGAEETGSHNWDGGTITGKPTCQAPGEEVWACVSCGAVRKETLPLSGHSFPDWSANESSHFRSCTVCGKTESGTHNWNGGTVNIPATCQEEGGVVYVCSGCGSALVEVIPKLENHTYDSACDPDCNVCGAVRQVNHKCSTAWTKNSRQHWHACSLCAQKMDIGNHYPGPAATEEKDQLCLTCGYVMTPRLNHTHKFLDQRSSDETGHWYACEGCEERKDFQIHDFDSLCDPDCNVCGYLTSAAHDFGQDWQSDAEGHWQICGICGETGQTQPHVPGPEATEEKSQLCTVCGWELAQPSEHEHRAPAQWQQDADSHWKQCQCAEQLEKGAHVWDAGRETPEKTMVYTCTVCGAERTEELPTGGFPWWVLPAGVLVLIAAAGGTWLWFLPKQRTGKFAK